MTLGQTPRQADLFRTTAEFCESRVRPDSIHALLHRECFTLFPDELFGDHRRRPTQHPTADRRDRHGAAAPRGL